MDYSEDNLIEEIRRLDTELEELRAEVAKAEFDAVVRMAAYGGSYKPDRAPYADIACSICAPNHATYWHEDPANYRPRNLSVKADGDDGSSIVTLCDIGDSEIVVELELDAEMTAWLGNLALDVRDGDW